MVGFKGFRSYKGRILKSGKPCSVLGIGEVGVNAIHPEAHVKDTHVKNMHPGIEPNNTPWFSHSWDLMGLYSQHRSAYDKNTP